MTHIPGPDFPTGGTITNSNDLRVIYESGEGRLRVRAVYIPIFFDFNDDTDSFFGGFVSYIINFIEYFILHQSDDRFDQTRLISGRRVTSMIPNLLINGTTGIAVGMATNIPPHNPAEVINGVIAYMDNPSITVAIEPKFP